MVSRGDGYVLWPQYFDRKLSRAQGRRVPADLAVKSPDAKWLESAAKKAGFKVELEEGAKHPSIPYTVAGRIIIQADSKEAAIRAVAEKMQG